MKCLLNPLWFRLTREFMIMISAKSRKIATKLGIPFTRSSAPRK
jgi:hypothetical protein